MHVLARCTLYFELEFVCWRMMTSLKLLLGVLFFFSFLAFDVKLAGCFARVSKSNINLKSN